MKGASKIAAGAMLGGGPRLLFPVTSSNFTIDFRHGAKRPLVE